MQKPRCLPHQTDRLFLTDGGIETWLMYTKGFELPHFSDFQLLDDVVGREALRQRHMRAATRLFARAARLAPSAPRLWSALAHAPVAVLRGIRTKK